MSRLARRLREDRELRDNARSLIDADIAHLRRTVSGRTTGAAMNAMMTPENQGAENQGSSDQGSESQGSSGGQRMAIIAAASSIAGAGIVWLARKPLSALFKRQLAAWSARTRRAAAQSSNLEAPGIDDALPSGQEHRDER